MIKKQELSTAIVSLIVLTFSCSLSYANPSCSEQFIKILTARITTSHQIQNLDELFQAFSHGLVPDLNDPSQKNAFELYRNMRFGDPNTTLNSGSLEQIAKEIMDHPQLTKDPFRDYIINVQNRTYPVTPELSSFLDGQVRSTGQTRANLFQVDANSGYWKKVLQYDEPAIAKDLPKDQVKAAREKAKLEFQSFLDQKLPPELRKELLNEKIPVQQRAKNLFDLLNKERKSLKDQNKDARPISQAIVDLVHTIGFHDPVIATNLKSSSGMDRLNAFRKALDERDRFAMELGFEGHFEEMLGRYQVSVPTGVTNPSQTTEKLKTLEDGIMASSQLVIGSGSTTRTIRELSLVEAPFRSCLGGSDCSSRTYLTRALDPNYHYFTITDEQGFSSGHITVVLGEAMNPEGKKVKIAFIDKIQNVLNQDLPMMIEGVRRSAQEKGYTLSLPINVGGENGLSNEEITRIFVQKSIPTDQRTLFSNFTPHPHPFSFPNKFSRSEQKLPMRPVVPLETSNDTELSPGRLTEPWKTEKIDLDLLVQASVNLKNGSLEDQLRYIPSMQVIKKAKLGNDPEFDATLARWIADSTQPLSLRKQVLLHEWMENNKSLSRLLDSFSSEAQINLIQNFLDTPRFFKLLLKNKPLLVELMVRARSNKKVRETVMDIYLDKEKDQLANLVNLVLDAPDIKTSQAEALVRQVKDMTDPSDIHNISKLLSIAQGTSIYTNLKEAWLSIYISSQPSETKLGQRLNMLQAQNPTLPNLQDFEMSLLAKADQPPFNRFPVIKTFRDILTLSQNNPRLSDFRAASIAWLKDPNQSPERKAQFLLSHFGTTDPDGSSIFKKLEQTIPKKDRVKVMAEIDRKSSIRLFEQAATTDSAKALLAHTKLETFQFHEFHIPEEGKRIKFVNPENSSDFWWPSRQVTLTKSFQIQTTPVTQAQWSLVMGTNPSRFQEGGVVFNKIQMHPNRPVENISRENVQKFIENLNKLDSNYTYRLPTEAEWEAAARADTSTDYSFGNNTELLSQHGWHSGNSGNHTHDVANLKPNPLGLYDIHGNVWEWVQDAFDPNQPPKDGKDPIRLYAATRRDMWVMRGGSWQENPLNLRSAVRSWSHEYSSTESIGFRLVRTPRIPKPFKFLNFFGIKI